jgi:uncharacterized membrane protein YfcA
MSFLREAARRTAALASRGCGVGVRARRLPADGTPTTTFGDHLGSTTLVAPTTSARSVPFAPLGRRFVHAGDAYTPAHRDRAVKMSGPLGLVAGLFGSVVGVGGGVLIVPAITSAVPIPQRIVTGTSLIAVLSTAAVSTYNFSQGGCVDPTAAAILGASAMLSAPIGALLTTRMDCNQLRRLLAYFLLCAAPLVPIKAAVFMARERAGEATPEKNPDPDPDRAEDETATTTNTTASLRRGSENTSPSSSKFDATSEAPKLAAIGVVAGLASGLLGIGGGTVVTPLLALVSPLPQASVLGTSLLAMLPPSAMALAQHHRLGNVDPRMGLTLAAGTAVGGALGSGLAVDAPRGALEAAFFVGMLFLSKRTFATLRPKPKVGTK